MKPDTVNSTTSSQIFLMTMALHNWLNGLKETKQLDTHETASHSPRQSIYLQKLPDLAAHYYIRSVSKGCYDEDLLPNESK